VNTFSGNVLCLTMSIINEEPAVRRSGRQQRKYENYSVREIPAFFDRSKVANRWVAPQECIVLEKEWQSLTRETIGLWVREPYKFAFVVGDPADSVTVDSFVDLLARYGFGQIPMALKGFLQLAWESCGYGPLLSTEFRQEMPRREEQVTTLRVFGFCTSVRTMNVVLGGKGRILGSTICTDTVYEFVTDPKEPMVFSPDKLVPGAFSVPDAVVQYFFLHVLDKMEGKYDPEVPQDVQRGSYYAEHMSSFSTVTFEKHFEQVKQIVLQMDPDRVLVAPGDGLGVVASVASSLNRSYIGGDTIVRSNTHPSVKHESFSSTLHRASRTRSLLVLSYVWDSMSSQDRMYADEFDACVILDSSLVAHGPGVSLGGSCWYRGPPVAQQQEVVPEVRHKDVDRLLFTENLLNLQSIEYSTRSIYVQYFCTMRRTATAKWSQYPSGKAPFVVVTVSEYLALRGKYRCIYVACLGAVDPPVHQESFLHIDGGPSLSNVFHSREIYLFSKAISFYGSTSSSWICISFFLLCS